MLVLVLLFEAQLQGFFWFAINQQLNLRIVVSLPQHSQNHISFLISNYIYLYYCLVSLIINIHFHHVFNRLFLVKRTIHIPHIKSLSIFYNLNPSFHVNSKLIINPIVLLSNNTNNAFTIICSCVSILSSPIFTITSLNISLFRLQQNILFITC